MPVITGSYRCHRGDITALDKRLGLIIALAKNDDLIDLYLLL